MTADRYCHAGKACRCKDWRLAGTLYSCCLCMAVCMSATEAGLLHWDWSSTTCCTDRKCGQIKTVFSYFSLVRWIALRHGSIAENVPAALEAASSAGFKVPALVAVRYLLSRTSTGDFLEPPGLKRGTFLRRLSGSPLLLLQPQLLGISLRATRKPTQPLPLAHHTGQSYARGGRPLFTAHDRGSRSCHAP